AAAAARWRLSAAPTPVRGCTRLPPAMPADRDARRASSAGRHPALRRAASVAFPVRLHAAWRRRDWDALRQNALVVGDARRRSALLTSSLYAVGTTCFFRTHTRSSCGADPGSHACGICPLTIAAHDTWAWTSSCGA